MGMTPTKFRTTHCPSDRVGRTMSQVKFDIDLAVAEAFLVALAPAGSFTFQTFPDQKVDKDTKNKLTRQYHGTLAEHGNTLARLNRSQ